MGNLLQSYNENLHLLTPTEERILDYMISNPEKCLECTINELSKVLKVSQSMIVKAARKLGYSGFTGLKLVIAGELNILVQREKSPVLLKDLRSYEELSLETIREAYSHLSEDRLSLAAASLKDAENIDIYSFGFDSVAGHDLYLKMLQSGKRVRHLENGYEQIISASNLHHDSVVVAISGTGMSGDLADALEFARKSGAGVITVAPEKSRLCAFSDVNLESYYSRLVFPEGGLITRIVQLLIMDILYMRFLELCGEEFEERYKKFKEALDYKRRKK
jgi:DNA-binding MurR/RpiR family transcriptional regulator